MGDHFSPICRHGNLQPEDMIVEEIKANYVVKAETSLQELSAKALLKPGDCRYYDSESTYPIYRCACPKFHWSYPESEASGTKPCSQLSIHEFISRLPRSKERIPKRVKEFILKIAEKMCEIHEVQCVCMHCMMSLYDIGTLNSFIGEVQNLINEEMNEHSPPQQDGENPDE